MRCACWLWLAVWIAAAVGCRALPDIRAGVCGNAVVEAGETCDRYSQGEATCRPPGAAEQCQLDCTVRTDGTRPACPTGWGCDMNGVCRQATGQYVALGEPIEGNAFSLLSGDFDGDGRSDILSYEAPGMFGATKFRVHYFDRAGALTDTWASPRTLTSLTVARVSDDERADVAFSDGTVGVLLGQSNRQLLSETYPTYFLPGSHIRIAGVLYGGLISNVSPLIVIADSVGGGLALLRPDESEDLNVLARLPGSIDELAGDPATGRVFTADEHDPCVNIGLALRGAQEAFVYSVCDGGEGLPTTWRKCVGVTTVRLEPPAPIERGPLFADINGDGHLDLLLGTEALAYVAYGDGQRLTPARPLRASVDGSADRPVMMPIAAGDFSADGTADLVYASGFMVSQRDGDAVGYVTALDRIDAAWSEARIVDLNRDAYVDVIAASKTKLDIDFFNGNGSAMPNAFVIPTNRPVKHMSVADLDGDLINDLAFAQTGNPGEASEITVLYGNPAGPPSETVIAARVPAVMQIGALQYPDSQTVGDLFIAYEQAQGKDTSGASLAWLTGNNRSPVCRVELTNFAADGTTVSVPGLRSVIGSFTRPNSPEALVLSSEPFSSVEAIWLMSDLRSRDGRPQRMDWTFDPRISPIHGALGDSASMPDVTLLMAAGDVDADGRDELIVAAPDEQGEHCFVATARVVAGGEGGPRVALEVGQLTTTCEADEPSSNGGESPQSQPGFSLQAREPVALEQSCSHAGQLAVQDLDGDGASDIVLLTGDAGQPRSLLALWNDGSGGFTAEPVTSLTRPDETPQAFALFRSTPDARLTLAYVTENAVRLVPAQARGRGFEDSRELDLALRHGTGIVATDIDGDAIVDLVIADSGRLQLLQAELER